MIRFLTAFYFSACSILLFNPTKTYGQITSLADLELSKIIARQERLFKNGKDWTEGALTREAQEIVTWYENFLLGNPKHLNGYILFGKFLSRTDQKEAALDLFLKADQINPNIAVVKQFIGNFLVEKGKPLEAFPFLLMTTRLSPAEPVYHFDLGNFIFLFQNELEGIEDHEKLLVLMHECFKEAVALDPQNFDYQLRFAQSFFDFNHTMHENALAAWEVLLNDFGPRTEDEIDYIMISKARTLLSMNKVGKSLEILKSIQSKALENQKNSLLKKAKTIDQDSRKKSSWHIRSSERLRFQDPYSFPIDPHLKKMQAVTLKLSQEKMLDHLKRDVIRAKIEENGSLSLEFSSNAN